MGIFYDYRGWTSSLLYEKIPIVFKTSFRDNYSTYNNHTNNYNNYDNYNSYNSCDNYKLKKLNPQLNTD